ncbi:hypothetical protein Saso_17540 [Streptomyces asoensis]|uniref:Uncharacterized protein n=1 Tax=Streptomyces asoensis TaxID=249586 RepID=A0ABQ3RW52_9ACTN|nr:hypothetical protein GCM10010496_35430 [Streptomyces asoensis]GHI60104.1 hypothetical protein Saso_17540 [Streptomyces asoensis]
MARGTREGRGAHRAPRPSLVPATCKGPVREMRPRQTPVAGAGYVGYSTPETCWTTRTTWQE